MGVHDNFGPRRTNRPPATPNYGPRKGKFEIDYYRQTYCFPEKLARIHEKQEKVGQQLMYYSKNPILIIWSQLVIKHVTN